MNRIEDSEEADSGALVPWTGRDRNPESPARKKGFIKFIKKIWNDVRGWSESDVARLKEAGVRIVEAKGNLSCAMAEEKLASASKLRAEANAIPISAKADLIKAQAEAIERVLNAINAVKMHGGDVLFDSQELLNLLTTKAESATPAKVTEVEADEQPPRNT